MFFSLEPGEAKNGIYMPKGKKLKLTKDKCRKGNNNQLKKNWNVGGNDIILERWTTNDFDHSKYIFLR